MNLAAIIGRQRVDVNPCSDMSDYEGSDDAAWDNAVTSTTRATAAYVGTGPDIIQVAPLDEHYPLDPATRGPLLVPTMGTLDLDAYYAVPQSGSGRKVRLPAAVAHTTVDPDWTKSDVTGRRIRRRQPSAPWDQGSEIG